MPAPIPELGPGGAQPPGGAPRPGWTPSAQDGPGPVGKQNGAGPEGAQDAHDGWGGPGWAWVPGSTEAGPVPECARSGPALVGPEAELDYQALLAALADSGALDADSEDQDGELAERDAAEAEGRLEPCEMGAVAALAVEYMDPGPAQAGWLGVAAADQRLDENGLAGVAIAFRRLASWAQAGELAAVAKITAAAAAADPKIGLGADGRPARVGRDALAQISLALMLTHYGTEDWADLAVTLTWRLPATGKGLAAGAIDLSRARLIAEVTSLLSEEQARAVEKKILPVAGGLTRTQLRERLTRAVIAADPEGAERRREQAERHADVRLYADEDQTATITASKQPQIHAAAGFARLNAMARARKAAGLPGSLGFHRSQVLLGLMLGTLPYIPPAEGAPPDQPQSGSDSGPGDGGPGSDAGPAGPGSECDNGDRGPSRGESGDDSPADSGPWDDLPTPRDEDAPPDDGLDDDGADPDPGGSWDRAEDDDDPAATGPVPAWPALGVIPPALARRPARPSDGRPVPGLLDALLPWTTLARLSDRPGTLGRIGPITAAQARQLARAAETDPAAQWRVIVTNAAGQAIAVTRIHRPRRARDRLALARDGPPGTGLVGRIIVTITQDTITSQRVAGPGGPGPPAEPGLPDGIAAALRAAAKALDRALDRAEADAAAGGCAHADESPAYRPPTRLREYVTARDVTCRNPVCRQPAWRADLDHTRPYDQHGRTCRCNLGGGCRRDHQLKQHPRWKLEQTRPGWFTWTTAAGRTYTTGPDIHPV
jgi:Domain of unknown function (DUF222)